jgi:GAF domain-containing protein
MPRSRSSHRRTSVLTHERFATGVRDDAARRELNAVREILHTLVGADSPDDVFQFTLDRVTPIVGASFASVYLVEGVSELMRLAAASNWPAKYRPWLGQVRVRIGFGPSGEAASERRVIEVPDVFADRGLEDWGDVARELRFRSLVALPLQHARGALGAVTFYFEGEGTPTADRRDLMRLVADLLSAAAEKGQLVDDLRRARAALDDATVDIERSFASTRSLTHWRSTLLTAIGQRLRDPLARAVSAIGNSSTEPHALRDVAAELDALQAQLSDMLEFAAMGDGGGEVDLSDVTTARLLAGAQQQIAEWGGTWTVRALPASDLALRTDVGKATRVLATLLAFSLHRSPREVDVDIRTAGDFVEIVVRDAGSTMSRDELNDLLDPLTPKPTAALPPRSGQPGLARAIARSLGGDVVLTPIPGQGLSSVLRLPTVYFSDEPPLDS